MSKIKANYSLKKYNTFGIEAKAKYFAEFDSIEKLEKIIQSDIYKKYNNFILGGGSNILLTQDFNGLILYNKIEGTRIIKETEEYTIVEVGGGMNWHKFVEWSVLKNLSGIENLALIPGTVGASPVQNIGAYGMEVKNTITKVHLFNLIKNEKEIFSNNRCKFEYRDSVFKKKLKGKVIITKVEFKLYKYPLNIIDYGEIKKELKKLKLEPSPRNITKVVIKIRNKKLPDPKRLGNSGSFFNNPIIPNTLFKKILIKLLIILV